MRKRAPVEVLTPDPAELISGRAWEYQYAIAVIPERVARYGPFSAEDERVVEVDKNYHYRLQLCYTATKETDHKVPDLALIRQDELADLHAAFKTLVVRAEMAQTVLARSKSAESRLAGEHLRRALLNLFQPPGRPRYP